MDRSNRFRRPPASDPVGAVRSSIANRLNASLFLRQLGFFLLLDLVLGAILLCGVVFYAENRCADVAALVEQRGVPTADTLVWMQASDYTIAPLDRAPEGRTVPPLPFLSARPELAGALRSWDLRAYYRAELYHADQAYAITVELYPVAAAAKWVALALLLWQALALLSAPLRNNRAIKTVLRPIQELTAATARLNDAALTSRRGLEDLAGELDKINAAHLDSRIDAEHAQKELRALAQAINAMLSG